MDTDVLNDYFLASRFKSAKRKKRLVKKDFEKRLIKIHKAENVLHKEIRELPLILLEKPYQKGWVRFYVLREDVIQSKDGVFFLGLLEKINTYMYSNTKSFTSSRKHHRKRVQVIKEQHLYQVPMHQWNANELRFSDKEKSYFTLTEKWSNCFKRYIIYYSFNEPWRYVLRVRPNMITHQKAVNSELESRSKRIDNYIEKNNLRHKITKVKEGWVQYKYYRIKENPKYINPIHNQSLNTLYEMYLNEKV